MYNEVDHSLLRSTKVDYFQIRSTKSRSYSNSSFYFLKLQGPFCQLSLMLCFIFGPLFSSAFVQFSKRCIVHNLRRTKSKMALECLNEALFCKVDHIQLRSTTNSYSRQLEKVVTFSSTTKQIIFIKIILYLYQQKVDHIQLRSTKNKFKRFEKVHQFRSTTKQIIIYLDP